MTRLLTSKKILLKSATVFILVFVCFGVFTNVGFGQKITIRLSPKKVPRSTPTPTALPSPTSLPTATPTVTLLPTATPTITQTKFHLGIVVDDYANRNGTLSSLQTLLNTKLTTISIYKQFGLSGNKDLVLDDLSYAKANGIKVQIAWEPWNPEQGNTQSSDYLKEIPTGKYDDYMRKFAQDIKAFGGTVLLRFGHEMDGDWYPWGRRPGEYVTAYRYIYNLFTHEGVVNVKWMWSVNVEYDPTTLTPYYPGNEYVDIIGIDGFNWGTTTGEGWKEFSAIFGPTYQYLTSNYLKPITISETASTELGGDKAAWINNMFSVLPTQFSKISEVVWFDLIKETDWRIDSTPSSLNAFQQNLSIP